MERRKFIKTSATAAILAGSLEASPMLQANENESPERDAAEQDNRPAEYLERVQREPFLPGPAVRKEYPFEPMPLEERLRRNLVPQRGFGSIAPGRFVSEALTSGNGTVNIELPGNPYTEQILFHHESLLMPWKRPLEAPAVADIFPRVREMILGGKAREAVDLAIQHMNESPVKEDTEPHLTVPAFMMNITLPQNGEARNYIRTVNFENGEITVIWTDEQGEWIRRTFVSRPDNAVIQWLTAPEGKTMNVKISMQRSSRWSMRSGMNWGATRAIGSQDPDMEAFVQLTSDKKRLAPKGVEACEVRQDLTPQLMIYKCRLDTTVDNSGYAGVTRVVRVGGSSRVVNDTLVVENAASVMLLTRIECFPEFSEDKVAALRKGLEALNPDYPAMLERHQKIHSEMLNRVSVDFGGGTQYGISSEELMAGQLSQPGYSPALIEKVFEMGRYWFILNSGRYPSIEPGINSTIDLQTEGAVQGDLREGMEAYFRWMEEIAPDCRNNARKIFGFRGTSYPIFPDKGLGVSFYYTPATRIGAWPYWISAGGCRARQFRDHYLATGDLDFLRNRLVPIYKELAQFYEDFLTLTDEEGNYIFVPSISPENVTRSKDGPGPVLINASMDIAVCREVLTVLIEACGLLGTDTESISKWEAMLAKLPPYLLESDGTLKEWAWPAAEERYSHRHVSHLYGVWPGDEIDPDRTPALALAAKIANRRRTFDTMPNGVAGETLAAYGRCHRALVGARLKDNVMVDTQLRQLIEQGYISTSLRSSREPYGIPVPDAQGALPALMMEMLLYSRPGVIEVLPALPPSLVRGSIKGMLSRSFARIERMSWDMQARRVDITVCSFKDQDITLIARHGIEEISAPQGILREFRKGKADCFLHLPGQKSVEISMQLGWHDPSGWDTLTG